MLALLLATGILDAEVTGRTVAIRGATLALRAGKPALSLSGVAASVAPNHARLASGVRAPALAEKRPAFSLTVPRARAMLDPGAAPIAATVPHFAVAPRSQILRLAARKPALAPAVPRHLVSPDRAHLLVRHVAAPIVPARPAASLTPATARMILTAPAHPAARFGRAVAPGALVLQLRTSAAPLASRAPIPPERCILVPIAGLAKLAAKDPDEVLDYRVDWSLRLDGDAIATSRFVLDAADRSGVLIDRVEPSTTAPVVWLAGGVAGSNARLTNHVVTLLGREYEQTLRVPIRSR